MIRLSVNIDIYSIENISRATEAYKNLAKIKVSKDGNAMNIVFRKCKYDEERTVREFENYLIGLENS